MRQYCDYTLILEAESSYSEREASLSGAVWCNSVSNKYYLKRLSVGLVVKVIALYTFVLRFRMARVNRQAVIFRSRIPCYFQL